MKLGEAGSGYAEGRIAGARPGLHESADRAQIPLPPGSLGGDLLREPGIRASSRSREDGSPRLLGAPPAVDLAKADAVGHASIMREGSVVCDRLLENRFETVGKDDQPLGRGEARVARGQDQRRVL